MRRTKTVDMSPEAVAARLHDLASLYELGVSLESARVIGPAEASPRGDHRPIASRLGPQGRSDDGRSDAEG